MKDSAENLLEGRILPRQKMKRSNVILTSKEKEKKNHPPLRKTNESLSHKSTIFGLISIIIVIINVNKEQSSKINQ